MKIGSVCTRRVVTVDRESTLVHAAALMREHHVGALVVTTPTPEGLGVTGIVTDRDLVVDVLARGLDGAGIRVGSLEQGQLASIAEDADLGEAIAVMEESGVRRLLVTDDERRMTGIVTLDDVLDASASQMQGLARVIRSGIDREVAETAPGPAAAPVVRIPAIGTAAWHMDDVPVAPKTEGA